MTFENPIQEIGQYDPTSVSMDRYHPCTAERLDSFMPVLGLEESVTSDPEIQRLIETTGDPNHPRVQFRKKEMALEVLLPLVEKTGYVESGETYDSAQSNDELQREKEYDLLKLAMFIASSEGEEKWPIYFSTIKGVDGVKRALAIKAVFENSKQSDSTATTYGQRDVEQMADDLFD
jgi:hypothetical protein